MTKEKFYITTAIDYVNSKPHIGHAYEKALADAVARWHRLKSEDVFFLGGTDDNAQKNAQAARDAKMNVKDFVDKNAAYFLELAKKLNISFDLFYRTTEKKHVDFSQWMFKKIFDNGDIYKAVYEGHYCIGCEEYKVEKDLVSGNCPDHGKKPEWRKEENYFFRMSKYQKQIVELVSRKGFIVPEERRNEILQRLKEDGLKDLCVSRKGFDWGIKTPIDPEQTIYVWVDALANYVSALDYPDGKLYKKYWPPDAHVIGKGINWFHTVIWPSLLLSAGIPLPKSVYVHGYLTVDGKKMSKSIGNVVDPIEISEKYGVDQLRYFLLREIPFTSDGDFSEKALIARINGELVSDLGNLVYRSLTLVEKFQGKFEGVDELSKYLDLKAAEKAIENFEVNNYIEEVWKLIRHTNKYINEKEPWKLTGTDLGNVLYNLLEAIRIISILVSPIMPETAEKINKQLDVKCGSLKDCKFGKFLGKPKKGKYLFEKIDIEKIIEKEFTWLEVERDKRIEEDSILIQFNGIKVQSRNMELERLKKDLVKKLDLDSIQNSKHIEEYRSLIGSKDYGDGVSVDNLIKIVRENKRLPSINTVADSYNLVSLKYGIVMGTYDRGKISGKVHLKIADGSEHFIPIGSKQPVEIKRGEYVYTDSKNEVITRIASKQSDISKVGPQARCILMCVQGNKKISHKELEKIALEAAEMVVKFCGSKYKIL
ncbi:MAG: methionine--tRNA ligase [Candidatus Aenigmarchaeota archaeon]|nr:methionine--tRNA ligase [Candidatus Aenigmarchaeota archaeon]